MPQPKQEKTVFISYRRSASRWITRAIFHSLKDAGYEPFMDVENVNAGEFERIILGQIAARAHFLAVLSFESLERLEEPNDWLRKEIEYAIDKERNIIPVLHGGLRMEQAKPHLTGKLEFIPKLNALTIPADYFDEAMNRLCTRFLKLPVYIDIEEPQPKEKEIAQRKLAEIEQENTPTPNELTAEEWFNRGYELRINNRLNEALVAFNNSINLNPQSAWAHNYRGNIYFDLENYDKAMVDYNEAIYLNPEHEWAYIDRGHAYLKQKDFDKALSDFNKAIQLDPEIAFAYIERGIYFLFLDDYDNAIRDFNKAIQINPRDPYTYNKRGEVFFHLKKYNEAINDFKKAIQLNPNITYFHTNLGETFMKLKEYSMAINIFVKALSIDPTDGFAKRNLEKAKQALEESST